MGTPTDRELEDLEEVTDASLVNVEAPYESSESQMVADRSLHAKSGPKGGRPRKDGIKPGVVDVDLPVPTPTYRVFKSDSTNPNQSSKTGWNFANSLPEWAKAKVVYYVYRDWPVLLDPGFDEEEEAYNRQYKYIDKISGNEPIQDDMDLLHRYGCGTYRVVAKDSSSKRKVDKPIFTVWVMNIGGSDYKSNPPTDSRINDVEQVDLNNPANKSYVAYLRGQGKLPEQVDGRVKEHEMATVEAVKEVTSQQGVLVKEIIGMARERGQSSDSSAKVQAEVMADASKRSHEMTTEAAKQSISMVRDAFDQAKAMLPTAATPAPTSDPIVTALALIDAIKKSQSDNGSSSAEVMELRNQLNQFLQRQIETQQKQIELLMEAKVTNPAASTSPFSAMKEGLESLEQFNGVMERLRGGKDEAESVVDTVADAAPKWMRPILPLLPGLMQGGLAWLQQRQQQPQVAYYQTPDGRILPLAQPQVVPQPQPQIAAPGMQWNGPGVGPRPVNQFGPQPVPSPTTQPSQDPIYQLLSSITIPLLNYLQAGGTGTDFADWFVGGYSQGVYEEVVQLGPDTLYTAISTFPPINTHPIYPTLDVEKVQAFVKEFCDPQWPEGDDEEEEVTGTKPEPGPVLA